MGYAVFRCAYVICLASFEEQEINNINTSFLVKIYVACFFTLNTEEGY
jgi:hypothetical protein